MSSYERYKANTAVRKYLITTKELKDQIDEVERGGATMPGAMKNTSTGTEEAHLGHIYFLELVKDARLRLSGVEDVQSGSRESTTEQDVSAARNRFEASGPESRAAT
ncbi:hypothetical protein F4778DRAFT_775478 [Xylariomycetidae sp. FL2044]|nr:hypothetical protein F4778DRAFT_775478 [Xylariomycetidae sp. FL2044]